MSIDVNVQNDLVIVTETTEDIVVNVSNAAGPQGPAGANGVGVPVGGTTGQVLKKFTNTDFDTYWAADASGLTSVGLSMPSAFAVSNSPLTSNGTIAVTGAGTADQYVRGDGQLANFPTNGGGGSSVNYYLNGSVSQGTFGGDTYYEMSKTPIIGTGTNFTRTNAQGNGYIASFITDAGDPALLNIPGGNWNLEFYFQASSGGGNPSFYAELYKVSSSNVFTLIASGSTNPEGITNGTVTDQYFTSIPVPQTALLATDRIAIRIFVTPSGRTITLHTENSNLCEVLTTFSTGLNALNGLTAQVQYFAMGTSGTDFAISSATDTHTFNLPTASGTNRGALSSADWTTFSGKVGGSGVTGQVAYWNGTSSQTGSNNLFWDAANSRLGIAKTPANPYKLDVNGAIQTNSYIMTPAVYSLTFLQFGISGGTSAMNITTNRNVQIYDSTIPGDGGQRLQVYGDAYIKGSGTTSASNSLTVQNSNGDNILRLRNDLAALFNFVGTSLTMSGEANYTIMSANQAFYFRSNGGTAGRAFKIFDNASSLTGTSGANQNIQSLITFAPTSGTATYTDLDLTSTINQTGGANGITRGLYIRPTLTAAADWRSIEWSNNSGWGLYGAGTADNYLAGKLLIGTTTVSTFALDVNGTARVSGQVTGNSFVPTSSTIPTNGLYLPSANTLGFASGTSARMVITSTGVVGIGTTSPTGLFEVKGDGASSFTRGTKSILINPNVVGADTESFITTSTGMAFAFGTAATERMRITSAGNLLVGTTVDNGARLQVSGSSTFSDTVSITSNTSTSYALNIIGRTTAGNASTINFFNNAASTRYGFVYVDSSSFEIGSITGSNIPLVFSTNQSERMRVKANGSVRYIPMATPGTADAGDVYYDSSTNKLRCYNGTSWNDLF